MLVAVSTTRTVQRVTGVMRGSALRVVGITKVVPWGSVVWIIFAKVQNPVRKMKSALQSNIAKRANVFKAVGSTTLARLDLKEKTGAAIQIPTVAKRCQTAVMLKGAVSPAFQKSVIWSPVVSHSLVLEI